MVVVEWIKLGAGRLCWDPDGFNLSAATPSVTEGGGALGELGQGAFPPAHSLSNISRRKLKSMKSLVLKNVSHLGVVGG